LLWWSRIVWVSLSVCFKGFPSTLCRFLTCWKNSKYFRNLLEQIYIVGQVVERYPFPSWNITNHLPVANFLSIVIICVTLSYQLLPVTHCCQFYFVNHWYCTYVFVNLLLPNVTCGFYSNIVEKPKSIIRPIEMTCLFVWHVSNIMFSDSTFPGGTDPLAWYTY